MPPRFFERVHGPEMLHLLPCLTTPMPVYIGITTVSGCTPMPGQNFFSGESREKEAGGQPHINVKRIEEQSLRDAGTFK